MYIPRPAKLLFTIDDGWNKFLEKFGGSVSPWTKLSVERMLACGTCAMGVRRFYCSSPGCSHSRFFCQICKSKACSSCGFKATEQWTAQQVHIMLDCDCQHITFTMPHIPWPFFNNNWPLLNALFSAATRAMLRWARRQGVEVGIFAPCIRTVTSSTSILIFTCPSPVAGLMSGMESGATSSLKSMPWRESGAEPSSGCCGTAMT